MEGGLRIPSLPVPPRGPRGRRSVPRHGFEGDHTSFRFGSIRAFEPFSAGRVKKRASRIAYKRRFQLDL